MKLVHKLTLHIIAIFITVIGIFTYINIKLLDDFKQNIEQIIKKSIYENTKNELKIYAQIAKAVILNDEFTNEKEKIKKYAYTLFKQISFMYENNASKELIINYIKNYKYEIDKDKGKFFITQCNLIEGFKNNTFYKKFYPFNFCIATKLKNKKLLKIQKLFNSLTFGHKNYFFAYLLDQNKTTLLIHPFEKNLIGKNIDINKIKDIKGKYFKKEIFKKALNGGGFTEYYFKNPATGKIEKKLTYSIYLPKQKLILAIGVYIRDVNYYIQLANKKFNKLNTKILCYNLTLTLIILILSIWLSSILIKNFLVNPIQNIQKATVIFKSEDLQNSDIDQILKDFEEFEKETTKKLQTLYDLIKKI